MADIRDEVFAHLFQFFDFRDVVKDDGRSLHATVLIENRSGTDHERPTIDAESHTRLLSIWFFRQIDIFNHLAHLFVWKYTIVQLPARRFMNVEHFPIRPVDEQDIAFFINQHETGSHVLDQGFKTRPLHRFTRRCVLEIAR